MFFRKTLLRWHNSRSILYWPILIRRPKNNAFAKPKRRQRLQNIIDVKYSVNGCAVPGDGELCRIGGGIYHFCNHLNALRMLHVCVDTIMGKYLEIQCRVGKNSLQRGGPVPNASLWNEPEYSIYIELALLAQSVRSKLRRLRQNNELQICCVSRYIAKLSLCRPHVFVYIKVLVTN